MPNLATTRAILWRRLAALRRRFAKPAPAKPAAGAESAPGAGARMPAPLLVDYFGRDGSTAMLRLLSASPDVFVEGRYPYEHQHVRAALSASDPGAAWRAFCGSHLGDEPSLWYAEKMIDVRKVEISPVPGARTVVLLRDPRDTWVSIEAFSRVVGQGEIGGSGTRAERLDRFIERQAERLAWIAALDRDDVRLVRYETLVEDVGAVAAELSAWLGIELDPAGIPADFRLRWVHGTAPDPKRSVGRWRTELAGAELEAIRTGLGERMDAVGFSDDG